MTQKTLSLDIQNILNWGSSLYKSQNLSVKVVLDSFGILNPWNIEKKEKSPNMNYSNFPKPQFGY